MRSSTILPLALSVLFAASTVLADGPRHEKANLEPVEGSTVSGIVNLTALPKGGTKISIVARGLDPGTEYLSLYYENGTCELEPYLEDDVIGTYTANAGGVAALTTKSEEDLDEIHSISVRRASDFALRACASFGEENQ